MSLTSYDALVQAAGALVGTDALAAVGGPADAAARAYLAANAAPLAAARRALGAQCRVPLRYEADFFGEHVADFSPLRNLAMSLALQLGVHAEDGEFAEAARCGVDQLELANAVRRGGLVTDFLIGVAVAAVGLDGLRRIRGRLDTQEQLALIERLRQIEGGTEPLADIIARDEAWERAVGYRDGGAAPAEAPQPELPPSPDECGLTEDQQEEFRECVRAFAALPAGSVRALQATQDDRRAALLRMLRVDLALRAWHAAQGCFPERLDALAGLLADGVPPDPFTGGPFRYRRHGEGFVLYSPGPSGADHGGTFGSWPEVQAGLADLSLDGEGGDAP